jgi:hypothetical protein
VKSAASVHFTNKGDQTGTACVSMPLKIRSIVGVLGDGQVTTVSEETTATSQPGGTVRGSIGEDPKHLQCVEVTVKKLK